jgi:hypothetical protein
MTLVWAVVIARSRRSRLRHLAVVWLTLCLALSGAADAVSMVIRNLVRQLETPDAMRGA